MGRVWPRHAHRGRPFNESLGIRMGYDLHITRRSIWSDESGPAISEEEWLAYVGGDGDLRALTWDRGDVYVKNPDPRLFSKMVAAAVALGATVQGDDGESYDAEGNVIRPAQPGVLSRVVRWVASRLSAGAVPVDESSLPFKVGDRVRDVWGNKGQVTDIDVRASHGLGEITVKLDDGRISRSSAHGHEFNRADA